jgi:hypothetical protein
MWIVLAVTCAAGIIGGKAYGLVGALFIFIVAGGAVLYSELRRRRSTPQRVKDRTADDEAHDFGAALFQERLAEDNTRAGDERGP